jgi:predicted ATPase/DNA-binding winged helix-turn-helix (wHTH) protein
VSEHGRSLVYEAGQWQVHLGRRELLARGVAVPIGARAFEIVEVLVRSANELVSKDDLMNRIWPGATVGENTLQVHVSAIRKAFGSDRAWLKTESGRGYRLIGSWTARADTIRSAPRGPQPAPISTQIALSQAPSTNFPGPSSGLVGRTNAIEKLQDLLSAYRTVTLTGPGGIGKSALALEAARGVLPDFRGGGRFVELAALSDPNLVPSEVARVLGLPLSADPSPAAAVARAIGTKKMLLVLDNCEHVIDAAATLVEAIVRLCPGSTVLATSREILRIDGEHVFRVPPLDVPPPDQGDPELVLRHTAAELFLERVRALDSNFSVDESNAAAVVAICRSLDGIPLAIEFAAARASTLGVHAVAAGLRDRFALLTSGRRTALPRHRTLRAALNWSYDLLPETEASMLRHLAVFAGAFSLDSVHGVASDLHVSEVIERITSLAAKSLIITDPQDASGYYRLLETTRLYALEKLRDNDEYQLIARRHAEYYLALIAQAEAESATRIEGDWLATYGRHLDNLRAALDWAFSENGDVRIGVALTVGVVPLWFKLSLMNECRRRVGQALAGADTEVDPRVIMRLNAALAASSLYTVGATQDVATAWTKVLEIADRLEDTEHRLWARWGMWNYQLNHGAFRESLPFARHFSDYATNPADLAIGDRLVGISLHYLGEQAQARRHLENVLTRRVDAAANSMVRIQYDRKLAARAFLPRVLWLQGFPDQAMHEADSVVRDADEAGQALALCLALSPGACPVALLAGDLTTAERFIALLHARAAALGLGFWQAEARCNEAILLAMRGDVAAGLLIFHPSVRELVGYHTNWNVTGFHVMMAAALAKAGAAAEGLKMAEEALARSQRDGELWCVPELLRVRGECLLLTGARDAAVAAEAEFRRSLDWARRQEALSWELRSATSLARLLRDNNGHEAARRLLAPVYQRFREGLATADLLTARHLLETIG